MIGDIFQHIVRVPAHKEQEMKEWAREHGYQIMFGVSYSITEKVYRFRDAEAAMLAKLTFGGQ